MFEPNRIPAGKYIVTGSSDQMVKVWLYKEGVPTHVGVGHAGVVTNVRVSPDGKLVVSTSVDGGIYLWRFPHEDGVAPPSQYSENDADASDPREQVGRCKQFSHRKTSLPARDENISSISMVQNVQSVTDSGVDVTIGDRTPAANSAASPSSADGGDANNTRNCKSFAR